MNSSHLVIGRASQAAQRVKRLPAVRETWIQSLGREDPLEESMVTHSSTLAWRIPWTEAPGGLQSLGSQSRTGLSVFTSCGWWAMEGRRPGGGRGGGRSGRRAQVDVQAEAERGQGRLGDSLEEWQRTRDTVSEDRAPAKGP